MPMPTVDDLKSKIKQQGFETVEAELMNHNGKCLEISVNQANAVDLFLDIAKHKNHKHIFISVINMMELELSNAKIDIDVINADNYGSHYKELIKRAENYNKTVEKAASIEPYSIDVFFIDEGLTYQLHYFPQWVEEFSDGRDALSEFAEAYTDEINQIRETRRAEMAQTKEGIIQMLVEDPVFQECTTKLARQNRFYELIKDRKKYFGSRKADAGMIEIAWATIKANKR